MSVNHILTVFVSLETNYFYCLMSITWIVAQMLISHVTLEHIDLIPSLKNNHRWRYYCSWTHDHKKQTDMLLLEVSPHHIWRADGSKCSSNFFLFASFYALTYYYYWRNFLKVNVSQLTFKIVIYCVLLTNTIQSFFA